MFIANLFHPSPEIRNKQVLLYIGCRSHRCPVETVRWGNALSKVTVATSVTIVII